MFQKLKREHDESQPDALEHGLLSRMPSKEKGSEVKLPKRVHVLKSIRMPDAVKRLPEHGRLSSPTDAKQKKETVVTSTGDIENIF